MEYCTCARLVERNHNWELSGPLPYPPPPTPQHLLHLGSLAVIDQWGRLIKEKLPWNWVAGANQCYGFLALALSQLGRGGVGCGGGVEGTHISPYGGTSTIPLFPLPPSTHSLQPAIINPFPLPPAIHLLFRLLCCLFAPRLKALRVCSCVCVCVCVFRSPLKWHIDSQCSIFSHLAQYYRASQLTPYFSASLSLSMSIWVSCCWMEVFTRSVVLPLQEKGLEYQCVFLYLCMLVGFYFLTWNAVLSVPSVEWSARSCFALCGG